MSMAKSCAHQSAPHHIYHTCGTVQTDAAVQSSKHQLQVLPTRQPSGPPARRVLQWPEALMGSATLDIPWIFHPFLRNSCGCKHIINHPFSWEWWTYQLWWLGMVYGIGSTHITCFWKSSPTNLSDQMDPATSAPQKSRGRTFIHSWTSSSVILARISYKWAMSQAMLVEMKSEEIRCEKFKGLFP